MSTVDHQPELDLEQEAARERRLRHRLSCHVATNSTVLALLIDHPEQARAIVDLADRFNAARVELRTQFDLPEGYVGGTLIDQDGRPLPVRRRARRGGEHLMRYRVRSWAQGNPLPGLDVTTDSQRVAADEAAARALRHGWDDVAVLIEGERPMKGAVARQWAVTHVAARGPILSREARGLLGLLAGVNVVGFDTRDSAYTALAGLELEARDLAVVSDGRHFITLAGAQLALSTA